MSNFISTAPEKPKSKKSNATSTPEPQQRFAPWHTKYRPVSFDDLVGQTLANKTLSNLITTGSIPNALMLLGPRGTGKTSSARVFAKSISCLASEVPTLTPCGECISCRGIERGNSLDFIEIDAASNNGVDNMRQLIETSSLCPAYGRYKVIVIDECHTITRQGQNAFLKTLEEPAKNVLFILATTEPQKLLDTIASRCLSIRFQRIKEVDIVSRLEEIALVEGVNATRESLQAIAKASQGGMRDSIQLLFQLASSGKAASADAVYELIGGVTPRVLNHLLEAVLKGNIFKVLSLAQELAANEIEPNRIVEALLEAWRDLLAVALSKERSVFDKGLVELAGSLPVRSLLELAALTNSQKLIAALNQLEAAERRIALSSTPHLWIQAILLSLLQEVN